MADVIERGRQRRQRADWLKRNRKSEALGSAIKIDLKRGLETFRSSVSLADITQAIKSGGLRAVMDAIPWQRLTKKLAPATEALQAAGRIASSAAYTDLPPKLDLAYDLRNPRLASYIENRTGELITTVQDGTLTAVREATARSFTHALTPDKVAAEIRDSIGLNNRQATALARYKSTLQTQGNLSDKAIDTAVSAYNERLLDQRAIMIARTETRFAQNAGQREVWQAAREQGLLPANTKRTWVVDGDPCPKICLPMNGISVPLDAPYVLPDKRKVFLPSESHPNCLCIETVNVA